MGKHHERRATHKEQNKINRTIRVRRRTYDCLQVLKAMEGMRSEGRVVDKLVREKMNQIKYSKRIEFYETEKEGGENNADQTKRLDARENPKTIR